MSPARFHILTLTAALTLALCGAGVALGQDGKPTAAGDADDVYATYGVHNDSHSKECADPRTCTYERAPGMPSDPEYPEYWTSHWKMYRVFNRFQMYPPPYDGKPPAELVEGQDYETSEGVTYYDSTWGGGEGAMEEHYVKRCLPIFPIPNNYTCSFISLGKTAYFVTYPEDRPAGMPPVCLFSPDNHPPRRDFITHLPYSLGDSSRLNGTVQGYSFWVNHVTGRPMQTGVFPDQTDNGGIMFGYAFESTPRPDSAQPSAPPYRHPQSFYFSGYPYAPANAPIVSQNYTDFAMVRPDPAKTWDQVKGLDPKTLPPCQLFDPPSPPEGMVGATARPKAKAPTWGSIGRRQNQ
ncbi:MAG TPA: hypothetical protein VMW27_24610 [Thermoanaerobaculia bacterium]|nr:hypothetical protein [Thermoanaerobaculia bacterium]